MDHKSEIVDPFSAFDIIEQMFWSLIRIHYWAYFAKQRINGQDLFCTFIFLFHLTNNY